MHQGYTTAQAAPLARASLRELQYWDETKLIMPSRRTGRNRFYDFADIVALRMVKELRQSGVSLQGIRRVAAYLKQRDPAASFANTWIVSDGIDVYERTGEGAISTLRQPGQHVMTWVIDLGSIATSVEKEIATMAA